MNKVVSIEISGQVFWIEEDAYQILKAYLQKIKAQLVNDECANEIYKDIELRIAELLYNLQSSEKKAVALEQVNEVIEQVGLIDSESVDALEETITRKSYLDPQNKILAGVCAGLAVRFGAPAFIVRLVFLGLAAFFGLGIALYLIFWISLDTNSNRNSALAAQGKAQTAKQIASFEAPKENPLFQLQRIIFLPFSIIGTLLSVIGQHFKHRRTGYAFIFKNLVLAALLLISLFVTGILFEFNQSKIFYRPILWILSVATMYLVVLGLVIYIREYYLSKPRLKVDKKLKWTALIPVAMFIGAISVLHFSHLEHEGEVVEKQFNLRGSQLTLVFDEPKELEGFNERVTYRVTTSESSSKQVNLYVNYSSSGKSLQDVKQNIKAVKYFYTFDNDTLEFDRYWTLKDDALNRGQSVQVTIEVPQNTTLSSSWLLDIYGYAQDYQYIVRPDYRRNRSEEEHVYFNSGEFFHELGKDFKNKLSENEREVLQDEFCEAFFISESWACESNLDHSVFDNHRFDRAFQKDRERINAIREYLLPDRSLFVSNLGEINELVKGLSIEYPVKSDFQEYIEYLLNVKSDTTFAVPQNSG